MQLEYFNNKKIYSVLDSEDPGNPKVAQLKTYFEKYRASQEPNKDSLEKSMNEENK